jgi:glucosylceramidase
MPSGEELSQVGWSGKASNNFNTDQASDAFDGDPSTIWSTGAYQEPGMSFQVDLGDVRAFYSIDFECSITSDVPGSLDVYLWQSGEPSSPVRTNVAGFPRTTIEFATPQVARYIRLVIAQKKNLWWCIDELHVRK